MTSIKYKRFEDWYTTTCTIYHIEVKSEEDKDKWTMAYFNIGQPTRRKK